MPRNDHPDPDAGAAVLARRSRRRITQGLLAVMVLVDVLFFSLALKPAGQRAREQREAFERLRNDLQSRRETLVRLRKIAGNIGDARGQDMEFYQEKFLPKPTGFSIIMEEVDRLAQANKVRKGAVSYGLAEVRGRPELNQVEINTTVEGDYANIVQFVNQVERSRLFLIIDNISVAGGGAVPGQSRVVRLTLRLVTFFRG